MDPTSLRTRFRALHERGCFVMPNPWDRGSAVLLAQLGFPALASTSAGFAYTRGVSDEIALDALGVDSVVAHLAELVEATGLPVNADFQSGYGDTPEAVAESVRRCVGAGVAGLSIEDATGDPERPLYELDEALDRLRAAREAIGDSGVLLTARAECFLVGHADPLRESLRRFEAYAAAGADVLYAPRMPLEHAGTVVRAVQPLPVNFLVTAKGPTVAELAALGVRRISVGASFARVAFTAFLRAAGELAERGTFGGFDGLLSNDDLSRRFGG